MTRNVFRFSPGPEEAGMRIDQFVAGRCEGFSRAVVRKLVDLGGVHVGGRRTRRCSYQVQDGEHIEVYVDGLPLEPFHLDAAKIIWQDKYLLALDKPAGVETQPTPARFKGTVYAALLDFLHDPFRPHQPPSIGMVQRLDRDTSGIMVFSTHPRAHRGLTEAFAGRQARKTYLALVAGRMAGTEGRFCSQLARSRATNKVKTVERGGKEAITCFRVREEFEAASLVEVEILTGRTHQIRAHFSEAGHPLLGDVHYSGPAEWNGCPIGRQMLHSWRLSFPHPVSGETVDLEAPMPDDMAVLLEELRRISPRSPR